MEMNTVPACVGIIMDGNRRWAKMRRLPALEGHTAGLKKTKEILRHAFSRGIETVIVYAFSTENWNRPPEEVNHLMTLFCKAIESEFQEIAKEGIEIRFIGDRSRLTGDLRASMERIEKARRSPSTGKTFVVALSYGGRAEILAGINRLLAEGKKEVREGEFGGALWSAGTQEPDLIIRTGGEKRLSNFLTWQSVYSELFFTDSFWPDFSTQEFDAILEEFAARERRHGK